MRLKFFISILYFCFIKIVTAQTDTTKIYNTTKLKRGFYKSYNEYLNNAPSIVVDFTVNYEYLSKNDSTLISADFESINDSVSIGKVWGFCDGKDVFIKTSDLFRKKYWRVLCLSKFPFFYYSEPKGMGFGPGIMRLTTLVIQQSIPNNYVVLIRDEKNKSHVLNHKQLVKLLSGHKELLENFEAEYKKVEDEKLYVNHSGEKYDALYIKYLKKLNEVSK